MTVAEVANSGIDKSPAETASAGRKASVVPKRSGSLVERAENAADEVNGQSTAKSKVVAPESEVPQTDIKGSVPATSKKA